MSVFEKTSLGMYSAAGVEFELIPLGLDDFSMSLSSTNMVSVSKDDTIFHNTCALSINKTRCANMFSITKGKMKWKGIRTGRSSFDKAVRSA